VPANPRGWLLTVASRRLLDQHRSEQARRLREEAAAALAATDELCVCDLAWVTERAENLVSHHARTLRSHGLASRRREGKMVLYRLTERGLALLAAVIDGSEAIR